MARPKSKNPRNKGLRIRMTETEHNTIRELADRHGKTMRDLFWDGIVDIMAKDNKEEEKK